MKGWCKIIELEEHDVLVARMYEDDKDVVKVSFATKECTLGLTYGLDSEREAKMAYDEFDEERARSFVASVRKELGL